MESINIIPQAGLCNRLRVLFSYLEIANQNNKILNVFWSKGPACNGHFLDVFLPIENVIFLEQKPEHVDYSGFNPCIKMQKRHYERLMPNETILESLVKLSTEAYDAVHIRRTDHVSYANKKNSFTPDVFFENFIEKSDKKVYLACDNISTQKQFLEKYPEKIFINKVIKPIKSRRKTSLADSVIDMFMCIKSDKFVGTRLSSYSDLIRLLK